MVSLNSGNIVTSNSLLNPILNKNFDPFKQSAIQQSQSIETTTVQQPRQ